uniref:SJCHGC06615 protein n=1 Tax=Schistosoma japonicum TaxID=6182 RepID=Q5BS28_SCHJA|nr:SJCHGC06615 protein [Schistosoma japonicum]
MATRTQDFGIDVAISRKLNSRYDPDAERQVIGWIQQLTGQNIPLGRENGQRTLENGRNIELNLSNAGGMNVHRNLASKKHKTIP